MSARDATSAMGASAASGGVVGGIVYGVAAGVVGGIVYGVAAGVVGGIVYGVAGGIVYGVALGVVLGIVRDGSGFDSAEYPEAAWNKACVHGDLFRHRLVC